MSTTRFFLLLLAASLAGCGHHYAIVKDSRSDPVMLLGHDPVAYFTVGKPVRGDPNIRASFDSVTYYFSNAANKSKFEAEPARYAPQYGGFCSSGAAYAVKLGSDPTEFVVRDGRLFIFGDILGKTAWQIDPAWNVQKADQVWPEAKRVGWRWQSLKRFVNKVSWYKNSAQINADYRAKHPNTPKPDYNPGGLFKNLFLKEPGWRAREGFGQPAVGFVGVDPCPPACPGTVSKPFATPSSSSQ